MIIFAFFFASPLFLLCFHNFAVKPFSFNTLLLGYSTISFVSKTLSQAIQGGGYPLYPCPLIRGSSRSRNASPTRLNASTSSISAAAGKKTRCGESNRCDRASFNIAPQLAAGRGTPRPRKLRVASARTAPARPTAACTSSGGRIFGRMCRRPQCPRRLHKLAPLHRHHLRPHQTRIRNPPRERQGDHHIQQTRTHKRHKRNRQQNPRKREKRIRHIHVQNRVERPAKEARNKPGDESQRQRKPDHATRHTQRDTRAIQNTGKDISPQLVCAKPVRPARRCKPGLQIKLRWRLPGQPRSKRGTQNKYNQKQPPRGRKRLHSQRRPPSSLCSGHRLIIPRLILAYHHHRAISPAKGHLCGSSSTVSTQPRS